MAVDHIRYDLLAQAALRGLVRTVLTDTARKGLQGDHHFFISFDTRADGVRLSPRLLAQYPEEMTIVLQHQFWDLKVGDEGFEVGLSFNGVPEKLVVPFAAIRSFVDPSVQFALQFEPVTEAPAAAASAAAAAAPPKPKPDKPEKTARPRRAAKPEPKPESKPEPARSITSVPRVPRVPAPAAAAPALAGPKPVKALPPAPAPPGPDKPDKPKRGEVVRLDRFRKK